MADRESADRVRRDLIGQIIKEIRDHPDFTDPDDRHLHDLIEQAFSEKVQQFKEENPEAFHILSAMNFRERRSVVDTVFESVRKQGLGVLGMIITDPDITEVMINGYQDIFVERNGRLQKLESTFGSQKELVTVIQKFTADAGRAVSEAEPIVDTRLKDGSRINVVMPPVALNGPIVTIRRFPKEAMTIEKLISYGSITPEVAEVLELLVRAKYNIFVSGGTGSGKTTFLNALSNFIPHDERIITIEDSAELQIRGIDNLVKLETKNAGPDGTGAVTITMLIKSALRMRPDRIVVGEVRGAEALDMLQAMNTGHDGSLSTGHANSTYDMLSRLETMVLQGAAGLPRVAICQQIASAVDIIIHLSRLRDKSRRTLAISEILGYDSQKDAYTVNPLYEFQEDRKASSPDRVVGKLTRTGNEMRHVQKLENAGIYRRI